MYSSQKNRSRKPRRVRQVGELVKNIVSPVLVRRSGMSVDLLAAWPELVGVEYAVSTRPEKIKWPNRAHQDDPFKPGILVVACDSNKALFFQHELSRICANVNVFFGFDAIAKIQILQKPVKKITQSKSAENTPLVPKQRKKLDGVLSRIDDPTLREKLEKLGKNTFKMKS